ncbi:MAG TPA: TorF family putative porin [Gallionella sp.]
MLKNKLLAAALASLFASPVLAEGFTPSANVSLVSNYLYRGISQTGEGPAIQGGFDVAHASGVYAGVWASSISWLGDAGVPNAGAELDTYLGYKGTAGDVGYDIGYLRYNYPGEYAPGAVTADTDEVYGAVSYSVVSVKLSYSLGDTFGVADAKGTTYAEVNISYPVADSGVTLGAHYGMQAYKGATADALKAGGADPTYADYKLSVTKDFSGYVLGLAYSSTNAEKGAGEFYHVLGKDLGKGTAVLSLSRAM